MKKANTTADPAVETAETNAEAQTEAPENTVLVKFKGSELIRAAAGTSRDILRVVLQPDSFYTEEDVKLLTSKFLGKEVHGDGGRKLDDSK